MITITIMITFKTKVTDYKIQLLLRVIDYDYWLLLDQTSRISKQMQFYLHHLVLHISFSITELISGFLYA